ncbi:hypothetical protein IFM89_017788 [Coptis chinensis]|uniref:Protein transport protein SEC23 n=1 Tax=Coptis chinensis TaxID=261450 RepID=A0A835IXA8_9MAGN|nr:hypothetical protein IFM89_017788 [Coptis chinensis]
MAEFMDLEYQDGVRMPWNVFPGSKQEQTNSIIPVSAIYTPLKPFPDMPVVPYSPLRCKTCRSILNPFSITDYINKIWICVFCHQRNQFPSHYHSISQDNLPAELFQQYTTIEYESLEKTNYVLPPVFLFVVDTCMIEEELGFLKSALSQAVGLVPDNSLVGLITFGTFVSVHELGFPLINKSYVFRGNKEVSKDQILDHMCFFDKKPKPPTGVIAGARDGLSQESINRFLLPASECEFALNSVLEELQKDPWAVPADQRATRCISTALSVAASLLGACVPGSGARIMAFVGGPSTEGPGAMVFLWAVFLCLMERILRETLMRRRLCLRVYLNQFVQDKDLDKDSFPFIIKSLSFTRDFQSKLCEPRSCSDVFACALDQKRVTYMLICKFVDDPFPDLDSCRISSPYWHILFQWVRPNRKVALKELGPCRLWSKALVILFSKILLDVFSNQVTMTLVYLSSWLLARPMYYFCFTRDRPYVILCRTKTNILGSVVFSLPIEKTNGIFEVSCSQDIKVQGIIGPCASLEKKSPLCSETIVGQGNTSAWKLCGLDKATSLCLVFDITKKDIPEDIGQTMHPFYLQFLTYYQHNNGQMRLRATTLSRRWVAGPGSIQDLIAGFDQEAAAVVMARLVSHKMESEADFDPIRWLDRSLIRICSRFGDYQKDSPSTFSLSPRFSIFPQFMFNLRRSQFVQVFNNSPDETAYFRMILNRENVANSVVMIQPSLISYSFQSAPEPVLLDVAAIAADRILLLDSYFTVVIFHGATIAQWRKEGYQDQPEHEVFAQLLKAPHDDADVINNERFPVPRLVVCDQYGSQARFLLAKLNPSSTYNSNASPLPGGDVIFTDDVSFEVFLDHLQRLVVQS